MRWLPWIAGCGVLLAASLTIAQSPEPLSNAIRPQSAAAVAPSASGALLGRSLSQDDVNTWLDGYLPFALRSGDIAGAVVVVVKDGQVLTARGYGYSDVAKRTPVDPYKTLFRPGSVSKLVTWTAVMQQVEAGKIDLDRDVNTYLDFKIPPFDGKPITMRQIMTHTTGFEEAAKNDFVGSSSQLVPLGAFIKSWTPERIRAPGTTPAYSNWATTLAAYIVERTSGMPFDNFVEQRIFLPLDMQHSSFRQPLPAAIAANAATGYSRASEPARPFEWIQVGPAGSLSASGVDMAKFMIAHLEQGRGIMKPETAAMMHNSPLDKVDPMSIIPPLNRMQLGFFETNVNGREVIAHLGDTENFHTSLHLMTNEGVGFYVSFNSAGHGGFAHPLRVNLFQDFADRYFPSSRVDGRVDPRTAASHAQAMTGLWEGSRHAESSWISALYLAGQTKVSTDKDGRLVIPALQTPGGAVKTWVEIAPYVWREEGGHERLAAKLVGGTPVRWSVDGESPFIVFDRVPAGRSTAWLLPLIYASLAILALTFLYWPVSWYIRRRVKIAPSVPGRAFTLYRATRIVAGLDLAVILGWIGFVSAVSSSATLLTSVSDPWLWLLQGLGLIIFPAAVGISAWNAWTTWHDGRRWTRKLWSVLIVVVTLTLLYVAVAFKLIAMTVHY